MKHQSFSAQRGFSLLEVTIALSLSGILLSGLWQLMAVAGQQREAAGLSSQTMIVAAAAKDYLGSTMTASLLALPDLAALGAIAQVRITDADPGLASAPSLQGGGFLPTGFVNLNSYGQTYTLFLRREDAGLMGIADAGDRLIGLLLTTGGSPISDAMGAKIASAAGAAGGFIYSTSGTLAQGTAGAWSADFSGVWNAVAPYASAGHVAALVNLLPTGMGIGGGVSGVRSIDDLTDARADYAADLNLFMGIHAGDAIAPGGQNNMGLGIYALSNVTTGDNNIALGLNSGLSVTTGNNNIAIGANASFADGTLSNQLNIGNSLYGNINAHQYRIGNATLVPGIAFDVGSATDSARLAVGNVAQRPACTSDLEGALRWNRQTQTMEACTGGAWMQPTPAWTPATGTPPTPNPGSGFFVMTESMWDGNLGGIPGANARCLTELTSKTNWMGHATALANGQLVAAKVRAFINSNTGVALTTYYFARVGDVTAGGANFTTDGAGTGPNNQIVWSAANYFKTIQPFWSGRGYPWSGTQWVNSSGDNCNNWTTNNSGAIGIFGDPTKNDFKRYGASYYDYHTTVTTCDASLPLVCFVHP